MNFFSGLTEMTNFKMFSIAFALLGCCIILPTLTGIIWFEKFGSDNKRTLINRLVSSVCWTFIQYVAIVLVVDIIRHLLGPLPNALCFAQVILRSSASSDLLLFYDAIISIRFVYIFVLKNPAAFHDEFWIRF